MLVPRKCQLSSPSRESLPVTQRTFSKWTLFVRKYVEPEKFHKKKRCRFCMENPWKSERRYESMSQKHENTWVLTASLLCLERVPERAVSVFILTGVWSLPPLLHFRTGWGWAEGSGWGWEKEQRERHEFGEPERQFRARRFGPLCGSGQGLWVQVSCSVTGSINLYYKSGMEVYL